MPKAKPKKPVPKKPRPARNSPQPTTAAGRRRARSAPKGLSIETASLADAQQALGPVKTLAGLDLTEKVKDLIRLAKEQGHLTYDDVNDALPDEVVTAEDLDQVHTKLRNLEIDIIDPAEVDRGKPSEMADDDESGRFDILDDPVRMYLRQMGKVPLLSRDQEVEICKRIEDAEHDSRRIIYGL